MITIIKQKDVIISSKKNFFLNEIFVDRYEMKCDDNKVWYLVYFPRFLYSKLQVPVFATKNFNFACSDFRVDIIKSLFLGLRIHLSNI